MPFKSNEGSSSDEVSTTFQRFFKSVNERPQFGRKKLQKINKSFPKLRKTVKDLSFVHFQKLTMLNHEDTRLMILYTVSTMSITFLGKLWPERKICPAWAIA